MGVTDGSDVTDPEINDLLEMEERYQDIVEKAMKDPAYAKWIIEELLDRVVYSKIDRGWQLDDVEELLANFLVMGAMPD